MIRRPRRLPAPGRAGNGMKPMSAGKTALLMAFCLLAFIACPNPSSPQARASQVRAPEAEASAGGVLLLSFAGMAPRTIMPSLPADAGEFGNFRLDFRGADGSGDGGANGGEFSVEEWDGSGPVAVPAGSWYLIVWAFLDPGETDTGRAAAMGAAASPIEVNPGAEVSASITLRQIEMDGEGRGIFSWNIGFEGVSGVERIALQITPLGDAPPVPSPIPQGDALPASGENWAGYHALYSGMYRVIFTLHRQRTDGGDSSAALRTILHVRQSLESAFCHDSGAADAVFRPSDFCDYLLGMSVTVAANGGAARGFPTLAAALELIAYLELAQPGGSYAVAVLRDIYHAPALAPPLPAATIALTGSGGGARAIRLEGQGSLFEVPAGATLELGEGIELVGHADNNAALVLVEGGGTLIMRAGSAIRGNRSTHTPYYGGGGAGARVMPGAEFVMHGGIISGNSMEGGGYGAGGGGARIGGLFRMHGGYIQDNSAERCVSGRGGEGGGVLVGDTGEFVMTGGAIRGNRAFNGGGAFIAGYRTYGSFAMSGGSVYGNTAGDSGGGVFVGGNDALFEMSGAASVYGNSADISDGSGGGVFVGVGWAPGHTGGRLYMSGGEIGNNEAASGGGVHVHSSAAHGRAAFRMTGGRILRNRAMRYGGTGGGVHVLGSFFMQSGVIYGRDDPLFANTDRAFVPVEGGALYRADGGGMRHGMEPGIDCEYFPFPSTSLTVEVRDGDLLRPGESLARWLDRLLRPPAEGGAAGDSYTFVLRESEILQARRLDFGARSVRVIIEAPPGPMPVLQLAGNGSLFSVADGAALELRGVALQGHAYNNAPLALADGGILELRAGSQIRGNTNNIPNGILGFDSFGGGTRVNSGGSLVMHGGRIHGNRTTSGGMNAGGVFVARGGTFDMHGGEISGNESGGSAGGVYAGGTFNMRGGAIFGNRAGPAGWGGGVSVSRCAYGIAGGLFRMSDGIIYGIDEPARMNSAGGAEGGSASLHVQGARVNQPMDAPGVAQRGTFAPGGAFTSMGALAPEDRTIEVASGALIRPEPSYIAAMARIGGGTFQMGSPEGTPNSNNNERPVRQVTLSSGFYMSQFQVTQGQWYDVMGTHPSFFNGTNNADGATVTPTFDWRNLPVESVNWYDALVFSNRLSMQRGLTPAYSIGDSTDPDDWGPVPRVSDPIWNAVTIVPGSTGYRLPTEAQWEFAARGGHGSPGNYTFSGSNTAAAVAWYGGNSERRTRPVGTRERNALGLYDMSGNVQEWVWDRFGDYPDFAQTDPAGPDTGDNRAARGGSWSSTPGSVRSAFRNVGNPGNSNNGLGFRLVRPDDPLAPPPATTVSVSRDGGPVQRFANLADALASVTDTAPHTITLYENQQIATWPLLPNQNITLQGWNNARVVLTHNGAVDTTMFNIQNASLTLGNNITLRGRPGGTAPSIVVGTSGTLAMLDGSEISGHATVGNISPILISGTDARLDIQGGEITGNNNAGGRLIAAVDLNNGVLTMSGGSITGNNTNASGEWADAAMSANNAVTATLSGTAEIGIIRLSPSDAPAPGGTTRVAIGAGWTGNIDRLDLAHNAATPALVAAYWDGRIVLSGSDGRTLTAGDVAQVALGYFVTTAMLPVTQRIIGHAIASSGADLGRLLLTGTAANPIQPPGATPADQLDWLRANAASGNYYLIELSGNAAIAPQATLVPAGTSGVTITLLGAGHTVNLDGNGSLFTVVDGTTLALGNITLAGHNTNTAPLVRVMSGGTLYMNEGSAITGNRNTGFGGGVLNDGTFTMHNGRISGNIAGSSGGGVWIQPSATFTMHNGEISDNHASGVGPDIGNGGGVAVNNGTFAMYGGTITGNTAIRGGGGVVVGGVGTFAMSGGTISGNEANLNGGGVYVGGNATFQIINGTIYGTGLSANRATGTGTALHMNPGGTGTAQRGTFDAAGAFVSMDNLLIGTNFRNDTISITNGVPQQ